MLRQWRKMRQWGREQDAGELEVVGTREASSLRVSFADTNHIVLSCCLLSLTTTHHTMHQCIPLTLSNNIITIRVRRSGSHFLVGIQSKNELNADILEINPCRHLVRCRHSLRVPFSNVILRPDKLLFTFSYHA